MNSVVSISNSAVRNLAVFDLGRASREQAKSITRIASGSRLADTAQDPGAYAVSLKLKLTGNALDGVEKGLMNAQSFLQAQEAGLRAVGAAVERMNAMATLLLDPSKSSDDKDAGMFEINALREEIVRVQGETFNGQKLYVNYMGDTKDPLLVATGESGKP